MRRHGRSGAGRTCLDPSAIPKNPIRQPDQIAHFFQRVAAMHAFPLSLLMLCTVALSSAARAADGIIHFQGAIVEPASCLPQVQSRAVPFRIECDAERARAAGKPADRFRLSARHVRVQTRPVVLKAQVPGRHDAQGYEVTLAYL
nr:hypothetical protein [Stenotrophomonas pavanii]